MDEPFCVPLDNPEDTQCLATADNYPSNLPKQVKRMQLPFSDCNVSSMRLLSKSFRCRVYQVRVSTPTAPTPTLGALKLYMTANRHDRDHEVRCYTRLQDLQGRSAPILLYPASDSEQEQRMTTVQLSADHPEPSYYPLLTQWADPTDERAWCYTRWNDARRSKARQLLPELHRRGVVHGSVQPLNIYDNRETGKFLLLDFRKAMLQRAGEHDDEFQQHCEWEHEELG